MLDVLIATVSADRTPGGLQHLGPHTVIHDTRKGWAAAANALLDIAAERGHDALFLDDDVTLSPASLALLPAYRARADVFGFTLITPNSGWEQGWRVASAGFRCRGDGELIAASDVKDVLTPAYVAHCTASALYLDNRVLRAGIRFPVWPGAHYEDVAFTFLCWLHGFRVAYLPGAIEHPLTTQGAGATKSGETSFAARRAQNEQILRAWRVEQGIPAAIAAGRIPAERVAL